jgi:hypothetical protein
MDKRSLSLLTDAERMLVLETEARELAALDEDALVELHTRIRRARGKYVGQYRRGAAGRVGAVGGRGKANAQNQRARDKAEVFEAALARVSTSLAKAAKASAAQLKAERLAAAGAVTSTPPKGTSAARKAPARTAAPASPVPSSKKAPVTRKRNASTLATGARRQAKRDAR